MYNLAYRHDDELIDMLAATGRRIRALLPARRLQPTSVLSAVGRRLPVGCDTDVGGAGLAAARSPNILLIPGTSSVAHLRENVAGAGLTFSDEDLAELESIGRR